MFNVNNVSLHFGARQILKSATFQVNDGERAAIIGPNGAGKSTLLKIVAGILAPETGVVTYPKTSEVGYLPQDIIVETDRTVEDECRTVYEEVLAHEAEMRDLEHQMVDLHDHTSEDFLRVADRYEFLMHETMRRDIHLMDSQIGKVLDGLGFKPTDKPRKCTEFSGGWQMRLALAKLLLRNPDILLLDEPTNHLDIETIEWLGEWIAQHEGSVLMVSHERAFMDRLVNKVVEVDRGAVIVYRGNYTESLEKRRDRREHQQRAYENQQHEISHLQTFIDRFRYNAAKAQLAQSRIKILEKMERIDQPTPDQGTIHFSFPGASRSGKEVLKIEGASKSYGPLRVFSGVDFTLYRGEKVALVGVNGAGKSTMMRILAGAMEADTGAVEIGSNVELSYFAQYDRDDLHPDNTVYSEFLSSAPLSISNIARDVLGAFLFSGDDIDKKIAMLSGGERTRLRLAKMLCGKANCLLMDEPTNHLDIGSRLTLEHALKQYDGAVCLVSHDRYFLDAVVTRVVEISDGTVRSYPGNYSEYLHMRALREGREAQMQQSAPAAKSAGLALDKDDRKALEAARKEGQKKLAKAEKRLDELEAEVSALDEKARELENRMASPAVASNHAKVSELARELKAAKEKLEQKEGEWAEAQVEVDGLREVAGV